MENQFQEAQRKMTEAMAGMILEMLNLTWETFRNDPVISELWSAMNVGGGTAQSAGMDPYQVIGLDRSASDGQVKKRYRELMFKLHPDTAKTKGTEFLFKLVTAAYQQISQERGWRK
jgi:DnaJ-domain-containing protein 1